MLVFHDPVPDIVGQTCDAVIAQAHYYRGTLVSNANVLFLRLRDRGWHRIFVQAGMVFWQTVDALDSPGDYDRHHYPLTDLGVAHGFADKRVIDVRHVDLPSGGELQFVFAGAPTLALRHVDAVSSFVVEAAR